MIRILHLEDNDDDAELIRATLCQGDVACSVTRVETRQTFLEAMECDDWDIILADYSLPSFDGISALDLAVMRRPGVPFIFVTGALGEELAVETLKNGATDYVLKHRLSRLPQAVIRARREGESVKAQRGADLKLIASLREKELLLQEVHHRVKNNLQIICSLLNMQASTVDDPLLTAALQESQRRVMSMAMIHEMLYASTSLNEIDFGEYSQLLGTEVCNSYGIGPDRIRLVFELEHIPLEIDRAIPCGLILNELISNAFKYAFPGGRSGKICVSLRQSEDTIQLMVEDTGVGLPAGGSPGEKKSLGLKIVDILVKQLGGSMAITSSPSARFVLKFSRLIG